MDHKHFFCTFNLNESSGYNGTKTIKVQVPEAAAKRYMDMSPSKKKSISKKLTHLLENRRGLQEIMNDMSEQAQKNGLTPEILEELLKND